MILPIAVPTLAYKTLGLNWWAGFILYVFIFAAVCLWVAREQVMMTMNFIEVSLFGKTLDKGNWKPGELRKTKMFAWKEGVKKNVDRDTKEG